MSGAARAVAIGLRAVRLGELCHVDHAMSCHVDHAMACHVDHAMSCHVDHAMSCHVDHVMSCHVDHAIMLDGLCRTVGGDRIAGLVGQGGGSPCGSGGGSKGTGAPHTGSTTISVIQCCPAQLCQLRCPAQLCSMATLDWTCCSRPMTPRLALASITVALPYPYMVYNAIPSAMLPTISG